MLKIYKRYSFYIGNAIAFIVLTLVFAIFSLGMFINDALATAFYIFVSVTALLLLVSIYYLIGTIADSRIRKNGISKTAIIVKVYYKKYRYSPSNKMILFEYKDYKGNKIKTIESVQGFFHEFKEKERINILTNGKKGLLNRLKYK